MKRKQLLTIAAAVVIVLLIQYRQGIYNFVSKQFKGPKIDNPNPNEYTNAVGPNVQKPYWDEV